jgi:hypothetical protein
MAPGAPPDQIGVGQSTALESQRNRKMGTSTRAFLSCDLCDVVARLLRFITVTLIERRAFRRWRGSERARANYEEIAHYARRRDLRVHPPDVDRCLQGC